MSNQSNFKLEKWLRELDRIEADVVYLKFNNTEFLQLAKQFNDNALEPFLWDFAKRNYVSYMSMSIRRISGKYRDGVSLYKLLEDIKDNAESITSSLFLQEWSGGKEESLFLEFFGTDKFLKESVINNHMEVLDKTTKLVRDRADQFEAHIDMKPKIESLPTFNNVDNCVEVITEIYKKLYYLLNQSSLSI